VFEQHFDVNQVVQVDAGGDQPGAGGLEALAQVVPQVHELAGARAVRGRRVGVEGPVAADDGAFELPSWLHASD
jgi:hypothetical protein